MSIPVSKTLEEVRTDLFTRINEVQEEYAAKGWLPIRLNLNKGVVRGLIELWAWGLYQLYQFLAYVLQQAIPETATGTWLDLHARQVELTRRAATKASGRVTFSRAGTSGNVVIPAGTVVRTKADGTGAVYRYVTTAEVVLQDGATSVEAPVESEEYGAAANATVGMICEFSTTVSGVEEVANAADWLDSEGADEETDDALRERYWLRWAENNGVTKYAYKSWALSISGVVTATIIDNHPRGQGTVDVVLKGTAGIPTLGLIDSVDAVVAENVPVNDDYLVKPPTAVNVDISAELELTTGNESEILAEAEDRLRALFLDPNTVDGVEPLQVGEDLTRDRMVAALMAVTGVKRVIWTSPAEDVSVPADGLAVLNSLALTASWADEV